MWMHGLGFNYKSIDMVEWGERESNMFVYNYIVIYFIAMLVKIVCQIF